MTFHLKSLRKYRIPLLIALIVVVLGTLVSYNGGLIVLAYDSYPQNRQMPQIDNITAQVSVRQNSEKRTIIPGLLYYYRITPVNVLEILFEAPMKRTYNVSSGTLTACELKYGDGRTVTLAAPDKPLTVKSADGDSVCFVLDIPALENSDLTLTCKGYLADADGQKVLSSVFKKMTYTRKRDFYLRSMVSKDSARLQVN